MIIRITLLALCLCGCSESPTAKAEADYVFLKKSGTPEEICSAALKAKQAWMDARNAEKMVAWSVTSQAECLAAKEY